MENASDLQDGDRMSFDDSCNFEQDSWSQYTSEQEPCNTWRGWKNTSDFSSTIREKVPVTALVELAAKQVAKHIPFECVEKMYPPVPEQLQLRIAFWSFPENEEDIRLYSCLANGSGDEFYKGETLYKMKMVNEALQIGFHLSTNIKSLSDKFQSSNVSVLFDRCKITSCNCMCGSESSWCSHVVALCLLRIHRPNLVKYRAPVSESLSRLQRDQLQKFAQYLISELPQQVLPTAQKILDELLLVGDSKINRLSGAPDPTAGGSALEMTKWCIDESLLHENIKKTLYKLCLPSPIVFSDVNYLSSSAPPAAMEWSNLLRPLRGREPEGMWNLLNIICEIFKRRDRNAITLLQIITHECLSYDQILSYWYNTKVAEIHCKNILNRNSGNTITVSTQHACLNLCEEIVSLWCICVLNPDLSVLERKNLKDYLVGRHTYLLDKIINATGKRVTQVSSANHHQNTVTHVTGNIGYARYGAMTTSGPALKKIDLETFPGFKPAIEACQIPLPHIAATPNDSIKQPTTPPPSCSFVDPKCTRPSTPYHRAQPTPPPPLAASECPDDDPANEGCIPSDTDLTISDEITNDPEVRSSVQSSSLVDDGGENLALYDTPSIDDVDLCGGGENTESSSAGARTMDQLSENGIHVTSDSQDIPFMMLIPLQLPPTPQEPPKSEVLVNEPNIFANIRYIVNEQEILYHQTRGLYYHGYHTRAVTLASRLAYLMLASPPDLINNYPRHNFATNFVNHQPHPQPNAGTDGGIGIGTGHTFNRGGNKKRSKRSYKHLYNVTQRALSTLTQATFVATVLCDGHMNSKVTCHEWTGGGAGDSASNNNVAPQTANSNNTRKTITVTNCCDDSRAQDCPSLLALKLGLSRLKILRPPASSKSLEVKLANQESILSNLLIKIPMDKYKFELLQTEAYNFINVVSKISTNVSCLLPYTLSTLLFEALCSTRNYREFNKALPYYTKPPPTINPASSPEKCAGGKGVNHHHKNKGVSGINDQRASEKRTYDLELEVGLAALEMCHNISEADYALLIEGMRRQRGDLALLLLLTYKDDVHKLSQVMDKFLDSSLHHMCTRPIPFFYYTNGDFINSISSIHYFKNSMGQINIPANRQRLSSKQSHTRPVKMSYPFAGDSADLNKPSTSQLYPTRSFSTRRNVINDEDDDFVLRIDHKIKVKSILNYKGTVEDELDEDEIISEYSLSSGESSTNNFSLSSSTTFSENQNQTIPNSICKHDAKGSNAEEIFYKTNSKANSYRRTSAPGILDSIPSSTSDTKFAENEVTLTDKLDVTLKHNSFLFGEDLEKSFVNNSQKSIPDIMDIKQLSVTANEDDFETKLEAAPSITEPTIASNSSSSLSRKFHIPSEAGAHYMFEFAKNLLIKAGGNSNSDLFLHTTPHLLRDNPHQALHFCAFQIGLYALGLHNRVSPNWYSRTYSSHVSWVTGQALEIGTSAIFFLIDTWYTHLTPSEAASLADKASNCESIMAYLAAELALSCLNHCQSLSVIETQKALIQCKEQNTELLEKACIAVENVAKLTAVSPEVLFEVSRHFYWLCRVCIAPFGPKPTSSIPDPLNSIGNGHWASYAEQIGQRLERPTSGMAWHVQTHPPLLPPPAAYHINLSNSAPSTMVGPNIATPPFSARNMVGSSNSNHNFEQAMSRVHSFPPPPPLPPTLSHPMIIPHMNGSVAPPLLHHTYHHPLPINSAGTNSSHPYPPQHTIGLNNHSNHNNNNYLPFRHILNLPPGLVPPIIGSSGSSNPCDAIPTLPQFHSNMGGFIPNAGLLNPFILPPNAALAETSAIPPFHNYTVAPRNASRLQNTFPNGPFDASNMGNYHYHYYYYYQNVHNNNAVPNVFPNVAYHKIPTIPNNNGIDINTDLLTNSAVPCVPENLMENVIILGEDIKHHNAKSRISTSINKDKLPQGYGMNVFENDQDHYLACSFRVGLLALEALGKKINDERPQSKYAPNPPYGEDIKCLLRISMLIGPQAFQRYCNSVLTCIMSPFILQEVLLEATQYITRQLGLKKDGGVDLNPINYSNMVAPQFYNNLANPFVASFPHGQYNSLQGPFNMNLNLFQHCISSSNLPVTSTTSVDTSLLITLRAKCCQMYTQWANMKLSHLTPDDYEDFVQLLCHAKWAFTLTPDGPSHFNDFLQNLRRSKSLKKDLWQKIIQNVQNTP